MNLQLGRAPRGEPVSNPHSILSPPHRGWKIHSKMGQGQAWRVGADGPLGAQPGLRLVHWGLSQGGGRASASPPLGGSSHSRVEVLRVSSSRDNQRESEPPALSWPWKSHPVTRHPLVTTEACPIPAEGHPLGGVIGFGVFSYKNMNPIRVGFRAPTL